MNARKWFLSAVVAAATALALIPQSEAVEPPSSTTVPLDLTVVNETGTPWSNLDVTFVIEEYLYEETHQTDSSGNVSLPIPDNYLDQDVYVTCGPASGETCAVTVTFSYEPIPGGHGWDWEVTEPRPNCDCGIVQSKGDPVVKYCP